MSEPGSTTTAQGFTVGGTVIATDDPETALPPSPPSPSPPADAAPPPAAPAGTSSPGVPPVPADALRYALGLHETLEHVVPPWARVPHGLRFPRGRRAVFLRFPSRWTDVPEYGHEMPDMPGLWRQCILWSLSPGDEQLAAERALGNDQRFADELVKQAIRSIDGLPIDQTGMPTAQNVERFWAQLGAASRHLLKVTWSSISTVTKERRLFFSAFCVAHSVAS